MHRGHSKVAYQLTVIIMNLKIYTLILRFHSIWSKSLLRFCLVEPFCIIASENSFPLPSTQRHKILNSNNKSVENISLSYKKKIFFYKDAHKRSTPDTVLLLWRWHMRITMEYKSVRLEGVTVVCTADSLQPGHNCRSQFLVWVRDGVPPRQGRLHLSFGGV